MRRVLYGNFQKADNNFQLACSKLQANMRKIYETLYCINLVIFATSNIMKTSSFNHHFWLYIKHLYEASANRKQELMIARNVATSSPTPISKKTSELFMKIFDPPLPDSFGIQDRSGESAAQIELAERLLFVDSLILALQFFNVNVICA